MIFYIYLFIISFVLSMFIGLLIDSGLLGNNLRNKLSRFQNNPNKKDFFICLFIIISIISFIFMPDNITYFIDKETETALANVHNNNINIHNPNVNIPNSILNAVASLGLGGSVVGGMTTTSTLLAKSSAPLGIKIGATAVGGLLGGGIFVLANYANTIMQVKAGLNSKTHNTDIGSFSAKSMSENSDDSAINAVLGMFNINFIFNICILYLLIVLAILFISSNIAENKLSLTFIKNIFGTRFHSFIMKLLKYTSNTNKIWMLIIWIMLIIATLANIFMSGFFIEHLDLIVEIYQNSKK